MDHTDNILQLFDTVSMIQDIHILQEYDLGYQILVSP